jgi:hypothetical protein
MGGTGGATDAPGEAAIVAREPPDIALDQNEIFG